MKPMLCEHVDINEVHHYFTKPEDWIIEPKFDGERIIAEKKLGIIWLTTRRGNQVGNRFPEVIEALEPIMTDGMILDGELVAPRGFEKLARRQTDDELLIKLLRKTIPVIYYVFDMPSVKKALEERQEELDKFLRKTPVGTIQPVPSFRVSENDPKEIFDTLIGMGFEGIIIKHLRGAYQEDKRVWIKCKKSETVDIFIFGMTKSDEAGSYFGALLMADLDGNYYGKVGTGFSDDEKKHIWERLLIPTINGTFDPINGTLTYHRRTIPWPPTPHIPLWQIKKIPKLMEREMTWICVPTVAEIRIQEEHTSGRPRHPVFVRFKLDE